MVGGGVDDSHCCDTSLSLRVAIGQHRKAHLGAKPSVILETGCATMHQQKSKLFISLVTCQLRIGTLQNMPCDKAEGLTFNDTSHRITAG